MANETDSVPGYLLELAAAGELDPDARRRVLDGAARARPGADPLAELARDDAATLARLPPERVAAEVVRRARARPRRSRWLLVPALAATAAAALVAVRLPRDGGTSAPEPDGVRVKGLSPHLVVHRRTPAGAERVAPGATVRPGDLVQLGYVAAGRPFGVIVSLDGGGAVTRHWPADGKAAGPLESGREVLLPESFRLDAAPGFERFIFVTSARPFDVGAILDATRALASRRDAREARLPLAPGFAEVDVVLSKEIR
ncbi:MAG TPA: ActD-like protein [Anaeromyxobacter sp.]